MKQRRAILIIVCLLVIVGVPMLWLVRGSAPSLSVVKKVDSKSASHSTPDTPDTVAEKFDSTKYSLKEATSIWAVVNKKHPMIPKTYAPADLTIVQGGQYMRAEAAGALSQMFAAAKQAGLTLTAPSAYRSYDTQSFVYSKEVKLNGQDVADTQSARAGYSEHQTGLAVDVAGGGCSITDCFANTAEGKWVAAHAHEYGFVLRYPQGKQAVTGYRYEPWHFRYVGRDLANEMQRTGATTLEEFFKQEAAPDYAY